MSIIHIDEQAMSSLKELMEDEFKSLLLMFLEDSRKYIQQIELGLESENLDEIRVAAHTIKGSASNVGVVHLAELAAELETQVKFKTGDMQAYRLLTAKIKEEFSLIQSTLLTAAA